MSRKALMLLMMGVVLAWTAVGQAAPVVIDTIYYYAKADAYDTSVFPYVGIVDHHDSSDGTGVVAYATYKNATGYASVNNYDPGNNPGQHFMYVSTGETGDNRLGEAFATAQWSFKGPANGKVTLSFDYSLAVLTEGYAGAEAVMSLSLIDPQLNENVLIDPYADAPNPYHLAVSSSGTTSDPNAADSIKGKYSETLDVTPDQEYTIDLELWWVYSEGYVGTAATSEDWIDNVALNGVFVATPPAAAEIPTPSTLLLLGSGLAGLLGWGKRRLG